MQISWLRLSLLATHFQQFSESYKDRHADSSFLSAIDKDDSIEGVSYAPSAAAKEQDLQYLQHRDVFPTSTVFENGPGDRTSKKGGAGQLSIFVRCTARRRIWNDLSLGEFF